MRLKRRGEDERLRLRTGLGREKVDGKRASCWTLANRPLGRRGGRVLSPVKLVKLSEQMELDREPAVPNTEVRYKGT